MSAADSPLLPYQSRVIEEILAHNITVIEKSRRIGISWVLSWLAVTVASASASARGMDVFYMGYEKDMTRQFIDDCADHAKILLGLAPDVQEEIFVDDDKPDKSIKVFRIDFASGNHILALPSVARAFRSKQGLVILDEAAFVDDLAAVIKAALALRIWGAKIVILSTHKGDTNPFNTLVEEVRSGRRKYHLMRLTFEDAIADGLYHKVAAKQGLPYSPEDEAAWKQEILDDFGDVADEELHVIPSPSTGAYIPLALIEARTVAGTPVVRWACDGAFALLPEAVRHGEALRFCETELAPLLDALDPKTPHCLGEDFGRSGDLTVLWPLALERSLVRRTPFVLELRNVPFEQQRQILFYVIDRLPRFRAGKMDARGNGQYLAEVAVQRYGARIEAVMLSEPWYRENMPPLKAGFEDGLVTVPRDREIHDDIRSLALVRGVARVPDKRAGDKASKRHGDAAVAIAMAYAASRADPEVYGYRAAPSPLAMGREGRSGRSGIEREIAEDRAARTPGIYGGMRGGLA